MTRTITTFLFFTFIAFLMLLFCCIQYSNSIKFGPVSLVWLVNSIKRKGNQCYSFLTCDWNRRTESTTLVFLLCAMSFLTRLQRWSCFWVILSARKEETFAVENSYATMYHIHCQLFITIESHTVSVRQKASIWIFIDPELEHQWYLETAVKLYFTFIHCFTIQCSKW